MGDQYGWKQFVISGALLCLVATGSACAVAHAQTPPAGGSHGAQAGAGAACPPDAGAAAAADAGHAATATTATASAAPTPAPAYSGPPPYFFVRPPHTSAGLTPDAVHRVLTRAANQQAMLACYTTQLATNPHAHGLVSMRLEVIAGGFGTVDSVHVAPANDTMRDCIRNAVSRFEWPNPSGVPSTQIDAQIDLAPTPPAPAHGHH